VKAGDLGLDFSFGWKYKNGKVASLRNYILKYLAKTLSKLFWTGRQKNCSSGSIILHVVQICQGIVKHFFYTVLFLPDVAEPGTVRL
jgi:hypothetical protein